MAEGRKQLRDQRLHGGRAFSNKIQRFANTFGLFLGAYSQVIDIMRAADNNYGGAALQALALLLVV
jgi:hypothetical protein